MARLDPTEGFDILKDRVKEAISGTFPQEGAKNVLELESIDILDKLNVSNVGDQKSAKMNGRTWGVPVHATLVLKDKKTGKVLDRSKLKVATLPKITNRYSYIVDGSEYQVDNQWRLKPGVYTKIQQNGELDSFFNIQGQPMHVGFDPKQRTFAIKHGGAKPPLYPVMRALGHSDGDLEKAWGKDILTANMTDAKGKLLKVDKHAINFAKRLVPDAEVTSFDQASEIIKQRFAESKLHPDVTSRTLGKAIDKITPEAVLRSSKRLLGVARGEEKPDVRDSLMFKEFLGTEDFVAERLRQSAPVIQRRIGNNIDRREKVRDIVGMDVFQRPVKEFFSKVSLASTPEQTNPLKMISGQLRTTIAGEGGVKDANRITEDAKLVDPSHFGVLDPLHTPECLPPSMSVYTKRGWVQAAEMRDDDLFACNVNGKLEFHKAQRIIRERYHGTMYGMEHSFMSYLVTPNHRMWCRPLDRRTPNAGRWRFETAAQMHGKTRNFITTHEPYEGCSRSELTLPFGVVVDSSMWSAFMGWYLTEGSVQVVNDVAYSVLISQSESANADSCKEISWVLERLPFEWSYSRSSRAFKINDKELAAYLRQFGYCDDKYVPDELLELGVEAREELLGAMLMGDGRLNYRRQNGELFHDRDTLATTSPQLAADAERLIISLGYAAVVHVYQDKREDRYLDVYEVRIQRRSERVVRGLRDQYTVDYDGVVYCATVPGSMLYVRKDGKCPFWTGNSVKTGVNLQLSLGARKVGTKVEIPLINAKTGKVQYLDPGRINDSVVALPDSVKKVGNKFVPKDGSTVLASAKGNELLNVSMKDVQYVVPRSSQMFSIATNMVPFISSDSPNRATMAGRHMEQAIPLKDPEPPLVQSVLGKKSFDELVGSYASHAAPTAGTVVSVGKDGIQIKGADKKVHTVYTYDHYPLNDKKGMVHSTPLVKPGDKVNKGQVVADTNFTKGGVYAPGKNLEVAYMPWRGYNFEDGVVISETAAQKLTSEHLHKKGLSTREAKLLGTKKYQAYYQDRLNKDQAAKLDPDGVIKPGMKVKPGDTLVAALAEQQLTTEEQKLRLLHKSLVKPYKDKAITWDEDTEGEVIEVNKRGSRVDVHVKTAEPMNVGDKMVGRHGNKGIVTMILPDSEMPKKKDGSPIEVIMNPIGTPGRMNIGQVLETAASKIAKKTGRSFKVTNFEVENNLEFVENELKKHGLIDKETIVDPKTGKDIPGIQVGPQYILKMEHQVGKKMAARSRDSYDRNLVPKGGGPHGAQALGALGIYSMLAHGAKANIREMQTYKSDKAQGGDNDELWSALQAGEMLPPPRTSFAYEKFNSYLKAMGVNTEKDGNSLNLVPLTDKQVLEMSNGELKDAGRVMKMRTLQPEKGGLFDPKVTGGHNGTNWSHVKLTAPMPNPLFEKAVMSVAGIRGPQFDKIVNGEAGVLPNGTIVEGTGAKGATYGPSAVSHLLDKVNVKKDLAVEEARIQGLKGQLQNESRKRIKYLRALDKLGMKPTEAYMVKNVPVLPPNMRPIAVLDDGSLQTDDLNEIYKQLAIVNNKHGEFPANTPASLKAPLQADIYDHLKALTGIGGTLNRKHPGILDTLAGREGPKTSFAQDVLIKRKQDMTMRSTIVPEPSLALDEAEIPRKAAKEMYKPFLVRELRRTAGVTPLAAKKMIDEDDPLAHKALDRVVQERPVLLKRDPVLHKYGIQAFKPRLVEGKAIKIHPLVCSGFNADFDGDTMSAYVPITAEAVKEAEGMFPSRNLFSPATGSVMYTPGHESQVGLFMMADVGNKTSLRFKNKSELAKAVKDGKVKQNDVVTVGKVKTTFGRMELNDQLPKGLRGGKLLTDLNYRFTKKEQEKLFNSMAQTDKPGYPTAINKLKDIGNEAATMGSFSFGLSDFKVHKDIRDPVLKVAETKAARLNLNKKEDVEKFIDIYEGAMNDIDAKLKQRIEDPKHQTNLAKLEVAAGIKGRGYRQLTAAPILFTDAKGEVIMSPVKRSYAEGLPTADYWAATSGGRKGAIQRVQSVSEPGYLTKQMSNSTMDMLVAADDCGTPRGVSLRIGEPDVIGRYTVSDLKLQNGTIPANTMLTPDILNKIKNAKVDKVVVRSPMRCVHGKGVCAKCMGLNENGKLNDLGTNVGIMATQSIGERGTQLAMKAFHSGGVYEGKESAKKSIAAGGLERAVNILNLPQKIKGSAVLSTALGRVSKVEKDPAGGVRVLVGDKQHYVPADRKLLSKVRVGSQIKKGDPLTSGPVNPHELLPLTNMSKVQGHMAGELHNIYGQYGIKRRHSELMVRALSNVTKVENPGNHPDLLPGDFTSTSQIYEWNKKNRGGKPVVHTPVLRGVKTIPLDVQEDWMARLNHEHLKSTLVEAAQQGWQSNLHGLHPIPPLIHGAEFGKGTKKEPWSY